MSQDEKTPGAAPASANAPKPAKPATPVEPEPYDPRGGVYKMVGGKRVRVENPDN